MASVSEKLQWLVIPRKTTKQVNLVAIINDLVKKELGKKGMDSSDDAARELMQLRIDSCEYGMNSEPSAITINKLKEYYSQLVYVERRWPSIKINLKFTWSDCLMPETLTSISSIHYEKACVLMCLASVHSLLAVKVNMDTEEGCKEGCKLFQEAAGYINEIKNVALPPLSTEKLSLDLNEDVLSMYQSIMLAQAQALAFNKTVMAKTSPQTVAKLAAQVSKFFDDAYNKGLMYKEYVPSLIVYHVRFQTYRYQALSQFFQAKALIKQQEEKGTGYGEEIARLTVVEQLLEKAQEVEKAAAKAGGGKWKLEVITELARGLLIKTQELLELKKKENIMVYSDKVPTAIDAVGFHSLVKPTPIPELTEGRKDLFDILSNMVPDAEIKSCNIL